MDGPVVDLASLDLVGSCRSAPSEALRERNVIEIDGAPILVRFRVAASPVRDEGDFEHHEQPESHDE